MILTIAPQETYGHVHLWSPRVSMAWTQFWYQFFYLARMISRDSKGSSDRQLKISWRGQFDNELGLEQQKTSRKPTENQQNTRFSRTFWPRQVHSSRWSRRDCGALARCLGAVVAAAGRWRLTWQGDGRWESSSTRRNPSFWDSTDVEETNYGKSMGSVFFFSKKPSPENWVILAACITLSSPCLWMVFYLHIGLKKVIFYVFVRYPLVI